MGFRPSSDGIRHVRFEAMGVSVWEQMQVDLAKVCFTAISERVFRENGASAPRLSFQVLGTLVLR